MGLSVKFKFDNRHLLSAYWGQDLLLFPAEGNASSSIYATNIYKHLNTCRLQSTGLGVGVLSRMRIVSSSWSSESRQVQTLIK